MSENQQELDFNKQKVNTSPVSVANHHPNVKDIAGQRFGNWTVIQRAEVNGKGRNARWHCVCDCGGTAAVLGNQLRTGKSTGCLKCVGAKISAAKIIHGEGTRLSPTSTYNRWQSMRARAASNKTLEARRYAKRDIECCERWASYQNFVEDMGHCPSDDHTLDRIDNDLGYSKENCRWATQTQQQRNKSSNRIVIYNGSSMCVAEFAELIQKPYHKVAHLVRRGLTTGEICTALLVSK